MKEYIEYNPKSDLSHPIRNVSVGALEWEVG